MKHILFCLFLVISTHSIKAQAAIELSYPTTPTTTYVYENGGYAMTAEGTVHVLMVFAEFPDDQYDTNNVRWEKGEAPTDMYDWVDETWSSTPTQGSLTHYYNEMSNNNLKVTGKEIYVVAPHTRHEYYNMSPIKKRGQIQREILEEIDDTLSFADFDNWETVTAYNNTEGADGEVDMIIFVWRNTHHDSSDYKSNLDFLYNYGDLGRMGSFYVDGTSRTINTNNLASGVTIKEYLSGTLYSDPYRLVTHEVAHHLLGGNSMHNGFGFWGMLSDWGVRSFMANSFEKYQLGWIDDTAGYCDIDATTTTEVTLSKSLGDYHSTHKAIRIKVDASTNEYFYIENHQGTSYWENNTPFADNDDDIYGTIESGVYVVRQKGMSTTSSSQITKMMIPADGRYEWTVTDTIINPWDNSKILHLWERGDPDKSNGYHPLELVYHSYPVGRNPAPIEYGPKSSYPYYEDISEYQGDGKDAFKNDYKEVFSPWSNPNTQRENGDSVDFAMKLNSIDGSGVYSLSFYMNNPEDAPPSKPDNFRLSWSSNHPRLDWEENTEPDFSHYNIYKKDGSSYSLFATTTNEYYVDYTETAYTIGNTKQYVSYKITAEDDDDEESIYTDAKQAAVNDGNSQNKIAVEEVSDFNKRPTEYGLSTNYPNPFNPSTQIAYQIPKDSHVMLVVYNSLGQKVEILVNQKQSVGYYNVQFNASNLPTGIYFYRIQASDYVSVKKMLLMK